MTKQKKPQGMYHHPCGIALKALQTQKKDFQRFFSMV